MKRSSAENNTSKQFSGDRVLSNYLNKETTSRIRAIIFDVFLINLGFIAAFYLRYGGIPARSFTPYRESWPWLTALYLLSLSVFGVYKLRFRSSWQLFIRITLGAMAAALISTVFMYIFREKWGTFPTSIFIIVTPIITLTVFKLNQWILKRHDGIQKKIIVIGRGDVKGIIGKKSVVHRFLPEECKALKINLKDIDQIIIAEEITSSDLMQELMLLTQRFGIDLVFTPVIYLKLITEQINGTEKRFLRTFEGQRRDAEEFFIRLIDILFALTGLIVLTPILGAIALTVKLTSHGPVFYTQSRVGKDGALFTIYKFRTMYQNAEKIKGFQPACPSDSRITPAGRFLRRYRLDEIPQLFNILRGEMSLVGPRPENLFRVNSHKALRGIRLAVKPGLTGLAQIRGLYDLHPRHKLKYDYLYIQRRSLRLNLYILINTLPALIKMQGW